MNTGWAEVGPPIHFRVAHMMTRESSSPFPLEQEGGLKSIPWQECRGELASQLAQTLNSSPDAALDPTSPLEKLSFSCHEIVLATPIHNQLYQC